MTKLRDKAAGIDLSSIDAPTNEGSPSTAQEHVGASPLQPTRSVSPQPRSGVEAITNSISVRQRNQELEQKLRQLETVPFVEMLDPAQIKQSKFSNRDPRSFLTEDFQALKAEIAAVERNVQPIKVRVINSDGADQRYELVYGRRRHRACLELGLKVSAIVVHDMNDQDAFIEAEKENQQQRNLSPWEQGKAYADALDKGLFPTQRRLAAALGVSDGLISKALLIAGLPEAVVNAFPTPMDIQFRWGTALADAVERDPAQVTSVAKAIQSAQPRPPAEETYKRLIGIEARDGLKPLNLGDRYIGGWMKDKRGNLTLKIRSGVVKGDPGKQLLDLLRSLVEASK